MDTSSIWNAKFNFNVYDKETNKLVSSTEILGNKLTSDGFHYVSKLLFNTNVSRPNSYYTYYNVYNTNSKLLLRSSKTGQSIISNETILIDDSNSISYQFKFYNPTTDKFLIDYVSLLAYLKNDSGNTIPGNYFYSSSNSYTINGVTCWSKFDEKEFTDSVIYLDTNNYLIVDVKFTLNKTTASSTTTSSGTFYIYETGVSSTDVCLLFYNSFKNNSMISTNTNRYLEVSGGLNNGNDDGYSSSSQYFSYNYISVDTDNRRLYVNNKNINFSNNKDMKYVTISKNGYNTGVLFYWRVDLGINKSIKLDISITIS